MNRLGTIIVLLAIFSVGLVWVAIRSGVFVSAEALAEDQLMEEFRIDVATYVSSTGDVPFYPAPPNVSFVWINSAGETSSIRPPGWDTLVTLAGYGPIHVYMRARYPTPGDRTRIVFVDEGQLGFRHRERLFIRMRMGE